MIKEFTIHAEPTNKISTTAFTVTFLSSFAILTLSTFLEHYRGIVQLFGMGLLVASLLIFTKYISPKYFYEIVFDSEGTPLFVVNQYIGKRMTTLCRVAFYEIVKVEYESAKARKAHKTAVGVKKYSYVPTLMPEFTCRLYTASRHERAEILIEVSADVANVLQGYAKEARELMMVRENEEEY